MANGLFGGGNGKESTPYLVEDAADLNAVRKHVVNPNVYFKQVKNIDLIEFTNWMPIGSNNTGPFMGVYDGDRLQISNLTTTHDDDDNIGLFGFTYSGRLQNINLKSVNVIGKNSVGGLVGLAQSTVIEHCSSAGDVKGTDQVGGLIGYAYTNTQLASDFSTCKVVGDVAVGGLIGLATSCQATDLYAQGNVTGERHVGGLIGHSSYYELINAYATGLVVGTYLSGGLIGQIDDMAITNSYYDSQTSGQSDVNKGIPKTTAQLKQKATFYDWEYETIWRIKESKGYPYFRIPGPIIQCAAFPLFRRMTRNFK